MSVHILQSKCPNAVCCRIAESPCCFQVKVGWDDPLQYFFASVFDLRPEGDTDFPTVDLRSQDVDEVLRAVSPYAEIPPRLAEELSADRDSPADSGRPSLRMWGHALEATPESWSVDSPTLTD